MTEDAGDGAGEELLGGAEVGVVEEPGDDIVDEAAADVEDGPELVLDVGGEGVTPALRQRDEARQHDSLRRSHQRLGDLPEGLQADGLELVHCAHFGPF